MEEHHVYEKALTGDFCKLCGRDSFHPIHTLPDNSMLRAPTESSDGRKRLPQRRSSLTFNFRHKWDNSQEFSYRATISYYEDGKIGELFLNSSKRLGTALDANARDAAIFVSIALQYGAPLDVLRKAQARNHSGYPASPVGMALDEIVSKGWEIADLTPKEEEDITSGDRLDC